MKSLVQYIKEELNTNTVTLRNLQITYKGPENLFIQVPVSYSESDIQVYIEDTIMKKMPGGADNQSTDIFGSDNIKNISDAHFEYESINNISGSSSSYDIAWDNTYNPDLKDEELHIVCIKNIKYILIFDQFELLSVTAENYQNKLNEILNNSINNTDNLPFNITINTDDVIYQKV